MPDVPAERLSADDRVSTDAVEEPQTIEVSVGNDTIKVTQATVPTGIFPLPALILRWAGLK
jgi:hypothetical protein